MATNRDLLNEMKKLAGLQLNEYTIAEAPKKSGDAAAPAPGPSTGYDDSPLGALRQYDAAKAAGTLPPVTPAPGAAPKPAPAKPAAAAPAPAPAPAKKTASADDGKIYYRDPGDGGPIVKLGTRDQAGAGLYGDEKGRFDKMPGDTTRFFSVPGPEAAKPAAPAPAKPAPAPAKPAAPKAPGQAEPAIPAPLAPGGQFAPGSQFGLNPPSTAPGSRVNPAPDAPKQTMPINTPIPGFGPTPTPVAPLKGPAGPDSRAGSAPDRIGPVGGSSLPDTGPKTTIPTAPPADPFALGGGSDAPSYSPDKTIDALKARPLPNFMKPLPTAPFDSGGKTMDTVLRMPPKPAPVSPNPQQSSVGGGAEAGAVEPMPGRGLPPQNIPLRPEITSRNPVPVDKYEPKPLDILPGASSDAGMTGKIADDPSYPGYQERELKRDIVRPFQKLKSMWDSDNHAGEQMVSDDISRLKSLSGIKEDPINDKVGEFDREQMNKAATDARFSDKTGNVPLPPRRPDNLGSPEVKDSYTDGKGNQHYVPNAPAYKSDNMGNRTIDPYKSDNDRRPTTYDNMGNRTIDPYKSDKQERDNLIKKMPPGIGMTTIEGIKNSNRKASDDEPHQGSATNDTEEYAKDAAKKDEKANESIEKLAWLAGLR